eukprot:7303873-Pyramimonas_sp.AAC.1
MLLQADNRLVAAGRTQDSSHGSMRRKVGGEDLVHVGATGMHPFDRAHDQGDKKTPITVEAVSTRAAPCYGTAR